MIVVSVMVVFRGVGGLFFDQLTLLQSQAFEALSLLQILADQSIGVLTESTLP
jgi:coproporphyrinogen III oxidase